MNLPHSVPCPNGTERSHRAKALRDLVSEISRTRPHAATRSNGEEVDFADAGYPSNFTKGLLHDAFGLLQIKDDYRAFVEAINSENANLFDSSVKGAKDHHLNASGEFDGAGRTALFQCTGPFASNPATGAPTAGAPNWRGWESPRAGHVYELEGPDSGSLGMAPAPRVGSSELAAELAELYALALLRDVRFTDIVSGKSKSQLCADQGAMAVVSSADVVALLNAMSYYSGTDRVSSTPLEAGASDLNGFERDRRYARTRNPAQALTAPLTPATAFRGSTKGAHAGPYISQFLLVGSNDRGRVGGSATTHPGTAASYGFQQGLINYGALAIDQRSVTHKACLDYMTDWASWLDVQNGADFRNTDLFEGERRFITTPRDLATYVHYDALYEAYLNAVFIMDGMGVPVSKGFPEKSVSGRRTGFATFGGPHVLSLATEVATRCLKAVRRQKFNFHRRARPEALAARVTLIECGLGGRLGSAQAAFNTLHAELPQTLRDAVIEHNKRQNSSAMAAMRAVQCPKKSPDPCKNFADHNLLLPLAFPEGSPMHPAYGAGHATVAGGCVTMIKAYFEMFNDHDSRTERLLRDATGNAIAFVPNDSGTELVAPPAGTAALTIQGELDKLAANIAIGRNMAGVHYHSDYYDSLRLGERVAVGILLEQAPTYGEAMETTFTSFDGDFISISGQANSAPTLTVIDRTGRPVTAGSWWLRHVPGEQLIV